jgi:membrane protease YdiL (CAAX protease family)
MTRDEHDPASAEGLQPADTFRPVDPPTDPAFPPQFSVSPTDENISRTQRTIPDDLRVPWNWDDFLLLVGVGVIGTILVELFLVVGLRRLGISTDGLRVPSGASLVFAIAAQVLLDFALLGYLAAQIRIWYHAPFWRTIGWRPLDTGKVPPAIAYLGYAFGGFLLVAFVSLASAAFPPGSPLPIENVFQYRPAVLMYMFAAVFVAPLVEETLFRGYLYPVVARSFGVGGAIALVGALFGLLHAGQLWGGWWQIGLLILVGIILTAVRATARTVTASYVVHLVYNSVQVVAFLFATHGGRHIPGFLL